jgi:hypothetical protein
MPPESSNIDRAETNTSLPILFEFYEISAAFVCHSSVVSGMFTRTFVSIFKLPTVGAESLCRAESLFRNTRLSYFRHLELR